MRDAIRLTFLLLVIFNLSAWGNDPATRFRMGQAFEPVPSAEAWQLSNPPILFNSMYAAKAVDPVAIQTARTLHVSPLGILTQVRLPAALPFIFTGLKYATGRALLGVIVGELYAATAGVGSYTASFDHLSELTGKPPAKARFRIKFPELYPDVKAADEKAPALPR